MKEIVSLNLGEHGARVGSRFWRMISAEHGISDGGQLGCSSQDRVDGIGVFWEETTRGPGGTFRPRRMDVESTERPGDTMERIRREVERCDTFQGFQLCHSIEKSKSLMLQYPLKAARHFDSCFKNG